MKKNLYTNKTVWFIVFAMMHGLLSARGIIEVKQISDIQWDKKPFVVEFYSKTCPHCMMMAQPYQDVANNDKKGVMFYKVEVASNFNTASSIAEKLLGVQSFSAVPLFAFVDANGTVSEMSGQMPREALENKISKL